MRTTTIHKLADSLGVSWDGDKNFMDWCSQIVGKKHLDDMSSDELLIIFNELRSGNYVGKLKESTLLLTDILSEIQNKNGNSYE